MLAREAKGALHSIYLLGKGDTKYVRRYMFCSSRKPTKSIGDIYISGLIFWRFSKGIRNKRRANIPPPPPPWRGDNEKRPIDIQNHLSIVDTNKTHLLPIQTRTTKISFPSFAPSKNKSGEEVGPPATTEKSYILSCSKTNRGVRLGRHSYYLVGIINHSLHGISIGVTVANPFPGGAKTKKRTSVVGGISY